MKRSQLVEAATYLVLLVFCLFALGFYLGVINAPRAHADMCGPSNLPGASYLNPWVKGCQLYVPGAGNLPQVPVPGTPGTAPAPVYVPPWGSWLRP